MADKIISKEYLLFIIVFFGCSYFLTAGMGSNAVSRLAVVYAIVDEGKLSVDERAVDVAYYEGKYYSTKPPGAIFLGVIAYLPIKRLVSESLFIRNFRSYLVRLLAISLPSALFIILFYRFLCYFTTNKRDCVLVALAYALATGAFPYSLVFYSHQLAAIACFTIFYLLFKMRHNNRITNLELLFIGALMSFTVITDVHAIVILLPLLFYLLFNLPSIKKLVWLIIGSLIFFIPSFIYHYLCFDNPFIFGYCHSVVAYTPVPGSLINKIIVSNTLPSLSVIYSLTFKPFKGLFFYSPILILGILGLWHLYKNSKYRQEFFVIIAIIVIYFFTIVCSVDWPGASTSVPRRLIAFLPFITFPAIFMLKKYKLVFSLLALISFGLIFLVTCIIPPDAQIELNPVYKSIDLLLEKRILHLNLGIMILNLTDIQSILLFLLILIFLFVIIMI